jgi:hypothetical protein
LNRDELGFLPVHHCRRRDRQRRRGRGAAVPDGGAPIAAVEAGLGICVLSYLARPSVRAAMGSITTRHDRELLRGQ